MRGLSQAGRQTGPSAGSGPGARETPDAETPCSGPHPCQLPMSVRGQPWPSVFMGRGWEGLGRAASGSSEAGPPHWVNCRPCLCLLVTLLEQPCSQDSMFLTVAGPFVTDMCHHDHARHISGRPPTRLLQGLILPPPLPGAPHSASSSALHSEHTLSSSAWVGPRPEGLHQRSCSVSSAAGQWSTQHPGEWGLSHAASVPPAATQATQRGSRPFPPPHQAWAGCPPSVAPPLPSPGGAGGTLHPHQPPAPSAHQPLRGEQRCGG